MKTFIFSVNCSRPTLSHGHLVMFSSTAEQEFCSDAEDEYIAGSLAVFVCNPGYTLSGHGYSYCQGHGQWYPSIPTCTLGKGIPSHPLIKIDSETK